jgi:hypothetical protein
MLRKVVQVVDSVVTGPLEAAVGHEAVGLSIALAARIRRDAGNRAERLSRHVLHAFNLPAGSDVRRLLMQLALVEREIRELEQAVSDSLSSQSGTDAEG